MKRLLFLFALLLLVGNASALQVIPDQYGFGTDTRAAYGAENDPVICIVTDLTMDNVGVGDSTRNGVSVKTGSFRECVNYNPPANTGKIILFEVSGTIGYSASSSYYMVDNQYTSILGQSAPPPGVLLRNSELWILESDVLVQHLRFRNVTDLNKDPFCVASYDSETVAKDIVVDHVSVTWGWDETFLIGNYQSGEISDVTVSNSIIGEGIWNEVESAKCFLIDGYSSHMPNISVIGNYLMASQHRHPMMQSVGVALVNNYVYNANQLAITTIAPAAYVNHSIVGNVVEGGPMSGVYASDYIFSTFTSNPSHWVYAEQSSIYSADNKCDAGTQSAVNNWDLVDTRLYGDVEDDITKPETPIMWPEGLEAMSSSVVKSTVLTNAGAFPAFRDDVDTRLVGEANNGTGLTSQKTSVDPEDWPILEENEITLNIPSNPHGDDDSDGYTNLEEWIHGLAYYVETGEESGEFEYNASNYTYYKTITINQSMVNQSIGAGYFPLLVSITDSDLVDHAQSDGDDIVFANSTGLGLLPYEIESWNSTSGELVAWVNISDIKNVSTIRMYYNDSDGENLEDASGVWDSNYMMVHHLQETDIDGGAGDIVDSTSNNNDGTTQNMETADQVTGQIDGSMDFDGTNEYIDVTDDSTLDGYTQATWSAWMKSADVTIENKGIVSKYDAVAGQRSWGVRQAYDTPYEIDLIVSSDGATYDISLSTGYSLSNNTMTFVTVTYNAGTVKFYKDGDFVSQDANTHTSIYAGSKNAFIGAYRTNYFDGIIDEVKVSNTDRSAAYIQTDYNQTASPALFISVGDEQSNAPDTKFEYWTGSAWDEGPAYYYLWFTCYWYTAECANAEQGDSQATLKITNNGSLSGTPKMKLNESEPAGINIYVDDDNTFSGAVHLTDSYQAVSTELEAGSNVTLWAWATLAGADDWEFETYATVE